MSRPKSGGTTAAPKGLREVAAGNSAAVDESAVSAAGNSAADVESAVLNVDSRTADRAAILHTAWVLIVLLKRKKEIDV